MGAKKELRTRPGDPNGRPRPRPAGPQTTTAVNGDGSSDDGNDDASVDGGDEHGDGQSGEENQVVTNVNWPDGLHIYISDDLTKMRANLAYQARQVKRAGRITDTWFTEANIMIKYKYMRISQITCLADLTENIQ